MSEDKDARTEKPTAKRLNKAKEEGDVPMSQEVRSAAMLLAGLIVVGTLAPWVAKELALDLRDFIARPHAMPTDLEALRFLLFRLGWGIAKLLALPMGVFMVAAVAPTVGQVGLNFSPARLIPNLSSIDPIAGMRQLFSLTALVEAGKGVVKIVLVTAVVGLFVVPTLRHPDQIIDQEIIVTMKQMHWTMVLILFVVVLVVTVLAAADLFYQRWSYNEKLKMTKQEVKDEHKEAEGDPKIKSRIRALRLERHKRRMMAAVPKATVVVTNPTHYAVALHYEMDQMAAPIVVAKGVDYMAKRIRQIADIHEVPVVENPPLARALYATVEVDQEIPQEHYKAVAEVIGYVMRLKGKLPTH